MNKELIERFKFREACNEYINIARNGNKYLADNEPWKLIKINPDRVKNIMFISLQISSILAIIGEPFLPFASEKLKNILNFKNHNIEWSWNNLDSGDILIKPGVKINHAELLFEKIEDTEIEFQLEKLRKAKANL